MAETKQLTIRFYVEEYIDANRFIEVVGHNMKSIHEAVQLKPDGFGRALPDESTRQVFVHD